MNHKIYFIELFDCLGKSNYETNEIYLDKDLTKYPKLLGMAYKHEKAHMMHDNNYLKALIRDLKDYPKLFFQPQFVDFYLYKKRHFFKKSALKRFGLSYAMLIYYIAIGIYSFCLVTSSLSYYAMKRWQKK